MAIDTDGSRFSVTFNIKNGTREDFDLYVSSLKIDVYDGATSTAEKKLNNSSPVSFYVDSLVQTEKITIAKGSTKNVLMTWYSEGLSRVKTYYCQLSQSGAIVITFNLSH